mgnify:CR=1 FL=1
MNVLSLFDGIAVTRLALDRAGISVNKYYASEIDIYARTVAVLNHPEIIQLGDVKNIRAEGLEPIDLLIGGSPCQDLSSLGKGAGLEGERSGLFYEYLRILKEVKPKYFVLENVASMPIKERDVISGLLGVEPIMINSSTVSAQCRKRLYWSNLKITQPKDKGILLQDILMDGFADRTKAHTILTNQLPETLGGLTRYLNKATGQVAFREQYFAKLDKETKIARFYNMQRLSSVLTPNKKYSKNGVFRHLSVHELEALQTLPKDYTACISKSQRYKCLGNSFTCDVIAHILSHIPKENR